MVSLDETPAGETAILASLERRLGRLHARQRLGIEAAHEAEAFGQGLNFFHIENWYSVHTVIRLALRGTGMYARGCPMPSTCGCGTTKSVAGACPAHSTDSPSCTSAICTRT